MPSCHLWWLDVPMVHSGIRTNIATESWAGPGNEDNICYIPTYGVQPYTMIQQWLSNAQAVKLSYQTVLVRYLACITHWASACFNSKKMVLTATAITTQYLQTAVISVLTTAACQKQLAKGTEGKYPVSHPQPADFLIVTLLKTQYNYIHTCFRTEYCCRSLWKTQQKLGCVLVLNNCILIVVFC